MEQLEFHTREFPELEAQGARYVIVATTLEWRDGVVTNHRHMIPQLQRELRKRWFSRLLHNS